jgi:cytochrome b
MQQKRADCIASGDANIMRVWDLPIRLFHWILVLGCASAYLTAEFHLREMHVLIGYGLSLLLAARILWGFYGNRYARFDSFIFSPGETLAYMRSMFGKHPVKHYFGHNPAGALMVFTLLALLTLIFSTGLMALAVIDFEGPLLTLANRVGDETSYLFRHGHELLTDAGLALVALHLMGVVGGSIQHNDNLVKAMITGNKVRPSPVDNGKVH